MSSHDALVLAQSPTSEPVAVDLANDLFPASPPAASPPSKALPVKISTAKWLQANHTIASSVSPSATVPEGPNDDHSARDADLSEMANTRRASSRALDRAVSHPIESSSSARSRRDSKGDAVPGEDDYGSGSASGQPHGRATRSTRSARPKIVDSEDDADGNFEEEPEDVDMPDERNDRGGAKRRKGNPIAHNDEEDDDSFEVDKPAPVVMAISLHGRQIRKPAQYRDGSDSEEDTKPKSRLRRGTSSRRNIDEFVEHDEEFEAEDAGYGERKRSSGRLESKSAAQEAARKRAEKERRQRGQQSQLSTRRSPKPRNTRNSQKADVSYEDEDDGVVSTGTESEDLLDLNDDEEDEFPGPRNLRKKPKVDYYSIPALEAPPEKKRVNKGKQRAGDPFSGLPQNLTGAQWAALYPEKGGQPDSSDDDAPNFSTPRKAALFSSNAAASAAGFGAVEGGMYAGGASMDLAAGTPNNLGKVGKATLADVDPLGVASNISFESVGGLEGHIQQLKEMVSLPLLYPEVFERFNITPPRGVLFHGPPGTGKTLLARALAASCSTEGRKISFFMRKGADVLSKWVGEAERQLRLLFEEAKNCQPSIIFFDEIDGLAPVRSSKQEQIHASIVSTLLALMDGMDGRGQVIVIGATNRPDAIDPALRRPGRFDREFYFPLPNLEGRRKIIDIHTAGWAPPIQESFKEELAALTKGYGGADLRALCTEAALNAVQRTYPQIYKTNDRLVIEPETIDVTARDFMISQKNLIPSTARATSSAASPLPPQLEPLLKDAFEAAKLALSKVLPEVKRTNILEEAEWEDEGGGFEKEKMIQAFETLRVFRPRMLVCGEAGMGQGYVGAAILHHLEGFHVQTLDLATLVADSSRTMEAACVQLFVEAKRHKPSILFIPSLVTWCHSVTDTVKATIKGLLDGLDPSDPILLLAVVDGPLHEVPSDVRSWFGFVKGNRVVMTKPGAEQRHAFFADVIAGVMRRPNEFPDALPRRKRVLAKLAIAPPPPPRMPTAAEIQAQELSDQRLMEYLKWRLGPVLNELKKRYKRFTRSFYNDWRNDDLNARQNQLKNGLEVIGLGVQPYHNIDLDSMHLDLYDGQYHTPDEFLQDILKIQFNAQINTELENDAEAPIKAGQMVNHANVMIDQTFDQQFKIDCARMAERVKSREPPKGKEGKGKGKGKPLSQEPHAIAEAVAAGGGSVRYSTRSRHTGASEEVNDQVEVEDIGEVERRLKRTRREGEESQQGDEGPGPSKRPKGINGSHEPNGIDEADPVSQEETAASAESDQPDAPTSWLDGPSSMANLLNPASTFPPAPEPVITPLLPVLPVAASSTLASEPPLALVTPPPTATPAPLASMEFAGRVDSASDPSALLAPAATMLGGTATIMPSSVPMVTGRSHASNGSNGQVRFVDEVAVAIMSTPPNSGIFADDAAPSQKSSPIAVDPPTPEPLPDFELSESSLNTFTAFLVHETGPLTIDQLEQLRAACFDIIWRGRKDWNRADMLGSLDELTRSFVEEVVDAASS